MCVCFFFPKYGNFRTAIFFRSSSDEILLKKSADLHGRTYVNTSSFHVFFIQFYYIRVHILKLFSLNTSTTNVKTIRKVSPNSIQCFLKKKLCCRWVGDHWKEGLAKFGYKLERKVEKYKNPTTCWRHARTFCLKYGNIGPFLFFSKSLYTICNHFFFITGMQLPKKTLIPWYRYHFFF